jgi:HD superfamily phosphohydrolase
MYIWDALYGKIEFSPLVYKCMLSPEVQRLREVRLCNINSLCITGSSNTNRFEHSVGTAYLAAINIEAAVQKHLKLTKKEKETFIIAALLHDVANGPFGHSYEYIMEKKGFIPEQGLGDVLGDVVSTGIGAHKNSSPFETIFFGKLRALTSILNSSQKEEVTQIIAGCHPLSKLISDSIDLDNIDNVFRMAYHMGLDFRKEAPIKLAESMFIENGSVVFLQEAKTYLEEWYLVRQRVYKFLLLNPQEFAGKYMLTEAMDILFECISQGKAEGRDIKWNYTDYQLMEELDLLKEKWLKRKTLLLENIDAKVVAEIKGEESKEEQRILLKEYLEGLTLTVSIKEKGKTGESNKLLLSENFSYEIEEDGTATIKNRNMDFEISGSKLYKVVNIRYNTSQIISRLMTGDLYQCLMILETPDVSKYGNFLEYSKRITLEDELEAKIRASKDFSRLSIGLHPILDINKTERQLRVLFKDMADPVVIGNTASKKLLIGVFIKNEPYGLRHAKFSLGSKQNKLIDIVTEYFASYFENGAKVVPLYEEADRYGQ